MDIFLPLVEATQWVLRGLSSLVGNPGFGIILLTILIRIITFPITNKAMKSSLTMQTLAPMVREIQKRYKDDKARSMQETQELYQQYGVSQLGGCLPLLLQIPIFVILSAAIYGLSHNHDPIFSRGFFWIPDLSGADPLHILPVASGIFQLIAQRMALPPGRVLDSQARMMNNIMMITPLYITFIYWGWATGPVLYWTTSSVLQALQSYRLIGWGSLSDILPFLPKANMDKFMPRKLTADEVAANKEKKKGGIMGKLMEQAQEQQRTRDPNRALPAPGDKAKENGSSTTPPTTSITRPSSAATTATSNGKRTTATIVGGYYNGSTNGNGYSNGSTVIDVEKEEVSASSRPPRPAAPQLTYEQMIAKRKKRK